MREFRKFEEKLNILFIDNSITDKNTGAPTSDELMPSEGPTHDNVNHDSQSFHGVVQHHHRVNPTDIVDELK